MTRTVQTLLARVTLLLSRLPVRWHVFVGACSAAILLLRVFALKLFLALMDYNGLLPVHRGGIPACSRRPIYGEPRECELLREYAGYADVIMGTLLAIAIAGLVFVIVSGAARVKWSAQISAAAGTKQPRAPEVPSALRRANRVFEILELVVPARIAKEEIGDAMEVIAMLTQRGRPAWHIYVKLFATIFWVFVHAAHEVIKGPAKSPKKEG